jgi:death-on-curing protein
VTRPEPRWLGRLAVDEAHFRSIRDHGGAHGLRDEGALEAALARPRHRWRYEPDARLADLAAAYAFGLARDHPYVDGNKRIALVALVGFLDLNGVSMTATNADALLVMRRLGDGRITEAELADWIDAHAQVSADDRRT